MKKETARVFSMILVFIFSLYVFSCKKGTDSSGTVCTSCTASMAGKTTTPYTFCETIQEVKDVEKKYISGNKKVGASARCKRY